MKLETKFWILFVLTFGLLAFCTLKSGWQFAAIHFVNGQAYVHATPMFK